MCMLSIKYREVEGVGDDYPGIRSNFSCDCEIIVSICKKCTNQFL